MKTGTILIVDDNKEVLTSLRFLLEGEFSEILTASNPNQITSILSTTSVDVMILDMNFSAGINNGNEGLYWLTHIRELSPALPVVMLTAYGDVSLAVKALKIGAVDFLLKPWNNQILLDKINEAYTDSKSSIKAASKERKNGFSMLVGRSPAMLNLMKIVTKVARTDANILITGENGTGKEVLAREIHRLSSRHIAKMLTVDMGAISDTLFESELFGHERGAFTNAYESRAGKFEAATGSSLFMDEVGNLPLSSQAKLLNVLQSRNVVRIGSNKPIPIDIRLISATNKNIYDMVKQEIFREDLFYRINTIHLEIPPLRERGDDILLFIESFITKFATRYQKVNLQIDPQAIDKLQGYDWPGNIRELEHTIEKAVILCDGRSIRSKDIWVKHKSKPLTTTVVPNLEEIERQTIEEAILQHGGNLTATAESLGICRQTLYNKLKRFNI